MYGQKYKILDDDAKRNKYKMRNKDDDDAHPPSRCSLKTRSKARQRSNMVYSWAWDIYGKSYDKTDIPWVSNYKSFQLS